VTKNNPDINRQTNNKNNFSGILEKYYGKYLNYNKPQDSMLGRLHWVIKHIDQGSLYYLYVLYENLDKFENTYNLKDIAVKQKTINSNYDELEKTLKKEIQLNNEVEKINYLKYNYIFEDVSSILIRKNEIFK
jgi:hypothetical protein